MSNTYRITGSGNVFTNIIRGLFLAAAAIGGFFMLAFSAAFALFVVAGLIVFGLVLSRPLCLLLFAVALSYY